jgi:hypothetical protein
MGLRIFKPLVFHQRFHSAQKNHSTRLAANATARQMMTRKNAARSHAGFLTNHSEVHLGLRLRK